jgi:hypothetical protein
LEIESNSTNCFDCHKPLVWMSRSKRLDQSRDVYEFDFRCDSCRSEYRFRNGKLRQLKIERDPVAEHVAMYNAETDSVRNRRCPNCGGPLDNWFRCDWCHESYSVDSGELVPRSEEHLRLKPKMSDFYAIQRKQ